MLNVEWRTGIGYGDYVTGLGYAFTSCIKYQTPVNINFHWNHSEDHLFSQLDTETIVERCNYIQSIMKPHPLVSVSHSFNSKPKFRFINQLDEFNPLHGLWYSTLKPLTSKKVVVWTSRYNLDFPGVDKDPAYYCWEDIIQKVRNAGYQPIEVTYRTPVKEVVSLINECAFGIGYDGLVHQLFKFLWKPLIVFCHRQSLNSLLIPQANLVRYPENFLAGDIQSYINKSKQLVEVTRIKYQEYLDDKMSANEHRLYNTPIY